MFMNRVSVAIFLSAWGCFCSFALRFFLCVSSDFSGSIVYCWTVRFNDSWTLYIIKIFAFELSTPADDKTVNLGN